MIFLFSEWSVEWAAADACTIEDRKWFVDVKVTDAMFDNHSCIELVVCRNAVGGVIFSIYIENLTPVK